MHGGYVLSSAPGGGYVSSSTPGGEATCHEGTVKNRQNEGQSNQLFGAQDVEVEISPMSGQRTFFTRTSRVCAGGIMHA